MTSPPVNSGHSRDHDDVPFETHDDGGGNGLDHVFARRKRYWANGYRPIEVWSPDQEVDDNGKPLRSPGKQPRGLWRKAAAKDPPEAACRWPNPRALNTGIVAGEVVPFDVDILDQELVDQSVRIIESALGPTPLVRNGLAPKTLLVYRTKAGFSKILTPMLFLPDGRKAQVEVLADGQQFVADGIHPDTRLPYHWGDETPASTPLAALPTVTEDQARDIIGQIESLLREAGAREKEKPGEDKAKPKPGGDSFFARVNTAALGDIMAWAAKLFPNGRAEGTGAWRISSEALGRDLDEDISIHPGGIRDFGEEIALTPIDLVVKHGGKANALEAALWLCDALSTDPIELGYEERPQGIRLEDFYAYMPQHNYIFAPSREVWPAESVNSRIGSIDLGKGQPIGAALWLDRNRPVEQMTWAPGEPMIIKNRLISEGGWIDRKGVSCFNLYRPPTIAPGVAANAKPWVDHVRHIYPDNAEHIISFFAHRVQHPEEKINHALVLGGLQGIGKDTIIEPVKRAVGPWNVAEPTPTQLMGRFNGFVKSVMLRISEARDLGDVNRYQFYEHLKIYTAAPPDVIRCDEKHLREHSVLNVCGVVITTNHKTNGLYLPADDRRHYVAWSEFTKEDFDDAYWKKLWNWYEAGGDRHVAAYLAEYDLSNFNPKAPPPKTEAFWEIVAADQAPEDAELADALDRLGTVKGDEVERPNAVTISQIVNMIGVNNNLADFLNDRKTARQVPFRFQECGYTAARNPNDQKGLWKINGKRQVIYARVDRTAAERRRAAEDLKKELETPRR